jgi:hypothetical protein
MTQAVGFAADLLRDELGPGGLMCRESDTSRATWQLAIDCLESAATVPMIPLFQWRERKAGEIPVPSRVQILAITEACREVAP